MWGLELLKGLVREACIGASTSCLMEIAYSWVGLRTGVAKASNLKLLIVGIGEECDPCSCDSGYIETHAFSSSFSCFSIIDHHLLRNGSIPQTFLHFPSPGIHQTHYPHHLHSHCHFHYRNPQTPLVKN